MRRYILLCVDICLVLMATWAALQLRENFDLSESKFLSFIPYLMATAGAALIVFPAVGLNKAIWRFSGLSDYIRILCAAVIVSLSAVAITFAYNRLDDVSRSLPFLQAIMTVIVLSGARIVHRLRHEQRQRRKAASRQQLTADKGYELSVLIVGVTHLAEVYIQALGELGGDKIKVHGIVGRNQRHVGRLLANYPVLGTPDAIEAILDDLDVHGVTIDRLVVATHFQDLPHDARDALLRVERARGITLQFLTEILGLDEVSRETRRDQSAAPQAVMSFEIAQADKTAFARRLFWPFKRACDIGAALCLLVLCGPLFAIVTLLVAASVGLPVVFWQQRPGRDGRPFRLYKFRTMRAAHTISGRRLPDSERVSWIGTFLRRTRLDELPQLLNILRGDMSFVGPRPLLPCDQPKEYAARLLVRPGLTGWAQVIGGRDVSPEDKAALDVWYIRNAGFLLDVEIALRTVPMVIFGERISESLIERAWSELIASGTLKGDFVQRRQNDLRIATFDV